ncbi:MAG: ROK family protein [Candidatus Doudnabacteria bacterium]|nr:ROK family protein [Candidatus Doudnabacteria bacterium]
MNIIGLDIGGTKITGVLFDGKKQLRSLTIPTPKSLPSFKASLLKLVETLSLNVKIEGLGVGMAGIVDRKNYTVLHSPNLRFIENFNFKELFPKYKVRLDNDAKCFARAEAVLGQCKSLKNFFAVTLGTGVGGALFFMDELYLGSHGSAGEVGHVMMDADHTIEYYYQKARDSSDYKRLAKIVGVLLANIYNLIDVELVVMGGSVSVKNHEKFLEAAVLYAQKLLINKNIQIKVFVSNLENAGAVGAALLLKS